MPFIHHFQDHHPQIEPSVFLAESSTVIGEVEIGKESSIWFNAVIRGDVGPIFIGEKTNLQDGVIVHCSTGRGPTIVGNKVSVGHGATLHGCTIENEVLIGMGAIILDDVLIPSHTLIAAGALVPERKQLEAGYLYAGIPAKPIKKLLDDQIKEIAHTAERYILKANWYRKNV